MKGQQFIFLVFAFLGAANYIAASVASNKNAVDSDKPILGVSTHDGDLFLKLQQMCTLNALNVLLLVLIRNSGSTT